MKTKTEKQQPKDCFETAMRKHFARLGLLCLLLTGCSAQLLEDIGEVGPPRFCTETVKLFNTFSMRTKSVVWKAPKGAAPSTLILDLVFYNDKNFPIALSNSGNGVHYDVRFSVQGKDGPVAPKEANGVVLAREGKAFKPPVNPGPFGEDRKRKAPSAITFSAPTDQTKDVNFRIKPGEPQEGRLVFELPRNNYQLVIERKFGDKPPAGQPTDAVAVCKIPENDAAGPAPGMSGVY